MHQASPLSLRHASCCCCRCCNSFSLPTRCLAASLLLFLLLLLLPISPPPPDASSVVAAALRCFIVYSNASATHVPGRRFELRGMFWFKVHAGIFCERGVEGDGCRISLALFLTAVRLVFSCKTIPEYLWRTTLPLIYDLINCTGLFLPRAIVSPSVCQQRVLRATATSL